MHEHMASNTDNHWQKFDNPIINSWETGMKIIRGVTSSKQKTAFNGDRAITEQFNRNAYI